MVLTVTDLQREQQKNMHNNNFCEQEQKWKVGSFTTNTQNLCSLQVSVLTLPFENFSFFHKNLPLLCFPQEWKPFVAVRWQRVPAGWWGGTYPTGGRKWLACWLTLLTA